MTLKATQRARWIPVTAGAVWSGSTATDMAIESGNYFAIGAQNGAIRSLGSDSLGAADTGTYYYQVSSKSMNVDYSIGLTDAASVGAWGDLRAYVNIKGDGSSLWLAARNGGSTAPAFASGLSVDTWYDLWLVVDNATDTYDVYYGEGLGADGMASAQLVADDYSFRSAVAGDLTSFGMYGWNTDSFAAQVDNIQAIPEPSTFGLLAIAGGGLMVMRRRLKK